MNLNKPKGIIALDIDGTVTDDTHTISSQVVDYLSVLSNDGWKFIFITGRQFQRGYYTLQKLPFPFILAVQNGALLIELPSQQILFRKYLEKEIIFPLEEICKHYHTDFVIYSGFENGDISYFRPERMSPTLLDYVNRRTAKFGEKWEPLKSYSHLPVTAFSSIKCFADSTDALPLSQAIERHLGLHAPPNRDPFDENYFVVQGTHREATKGTALAAYAKSFGEAIPIIAAGDDHNDISMLEVAHVKIAMENGPEVLIRMADIIAPPATKNGIIEGLSQAIMKVKK